MNKIWIKYFVPFVFISYLSLGQNETKESQINSQKLIFSAEASYSKNLWGDMGLMYGIEYGADACNPGLYFGPKISSDFTYIENKPILGPKISFEADAWFIGIRINRPLA
jgi:hypothetical protein